MGAGGSGGSDRGGEIGPGADAEADRRYDTLDIEPIEGGWSIEYADGRRLAILADGRAHTAETEDGKETVRARWAGETLVVVRKVDRREVSERFDVTDDGKLLQVVTTMAAGWGGGGRIQIRRLYRPAAAEPPG